MKVRVLNHTGIIHSLNEKQIERLKEIFAILTESGWEIPNWILQLEFYEKN